MRHNKKIIIIIFIMSFFTINTKSYAQYLDISSGTHNILYGDYSKNNNLSNNTFDFSGTAVAKRVFGAFTNKGDSHNNVMNINGGTINQRAFAGRSASGDAYNNIANMTGGIIGTNITAGRSKTGLVYNNTTNISNGSVYGMASAGRSNGNATMTDNTINVYGGTFYNTVAGVYAKSGLASGNAVNIVANAIQAPIFQANAKIVGATTTDGTMQNNTVSVIGANISDVLVAGAYSFGNATLENNSVSLSDNQLNLISSNILTSANTEIYGAYNIDGASTGNTVNIQNGTYNAQIYGAYSQNNSASGNTVNITSGTFTNNSKIYGASSIGGSVSNNSIVIADGNFSSEITGAYSESGQVSSNTVVINGGTFNSNSIISAARTSSGIVTGNTLTVNAGQYQAGAILAGVYVESGQSTSQFSNNTIVVNNNVDLSQATLMGAADSSGATYNSNLQADTTLVVNAPTKVKSVYHFDNYELYVRNHTDATTPMLEADNIHFGENANVNAYIGDYANTLQMGQYINLFQVSNPASIQGNIESAQALQGLSVVNHLTYVPNSGNLLFQVTAVSAHPHSITFPEARLASFAFVNQADDMILGQGMASALAVTKKSENWQAFSAIDAGYFTYDTNADKTDTDIEYGGVTGLAGFSKTFHHTSFSHLLAMFFEFGVGDIYTDSNNSDISSVETKGNSNFYGGGLMYRFDMPIDIFSSHNQSFYFSSLARAGVLETDFNTDERYYLEYDAHTAYYGLGAALGYQIAFENSFMKEDILDVYVRYMWTQLSEKDQILDNEKYTFEAINSHQVRAGFQYNRDFTQNLTLFFGLAAQYEFEGASQAQIRESIQVNSTDFKGLTGLLELGIRIKPSVDSNFSFGANLEGMAGVRKGGSFGVDIKYSF